MLPLKIRKERNKRITKMLEECGIIIREKSYNDLTDSDYGFKTIGNHITLNISKEDRFFKE